MNLRVEKLSHTYTSAGLEERTVLQIEQWSVGAGQQALLRGISGSGKTTLLNILAGLLRPTGGKVWVDDRSLYHLGEAQRDHYRCRSIGYVFQLHHLLPGLSALENVAMPMAFAGARSAAQRQTRARELLAAVGLAAFAHHRPGQLSNGQRLRVALARALANEPRLLLADEPTAALDAEAGKRAMDLLQGNSLERGATLIVASHDPAVMARFGTVYDLRQGRLLPALPGARASQSEHGHAL